MNSEQTKDGKLETLFSTDFGDEIEASLVETLVKRTIETRGLRHGSFGFVSSGTISLCEVDDLEVGYEVSVKIL